MFSSARMIAHALHKHRRLLLEMSRRDLTDRYSGQIFGAAWAVVHPLATTAVFLFIFGVVFATKVTTVEVPADHTVYMISGLIPWLVASEVLARAPSVIAAQAALVKQVVFPLEVLPMKMTVATLPTMLIGFGALICYVLVRFETLTWSYLLLPPLIAVFYVFLTGAAFLLASVGIFFRDLKDLVTLYLLLGLYLAPIFYPSDWVPAAFRVVLYVNPMTYFVMMFHDAVYFGTVTSPVVWLVGTGLAGTSFVVGAAVYARLKPHFGTFL